MNKINRINQLNKQELGQPIDASWHQDYKGSNYIFISNLHENLKHKDILIIFSQYGLPTHLKLINPETQDAVKAESNQEGQTGGGSKRKQFAFLKFEKWESCVMTVDNLNGSVIMGSKILVDHCWFNLKPDEKEVDYLIDYNEHLPKSIEPTKKDQPGSSKGFDPKLVPEISEQVEEGDEDELKDPMENITRKRLIDEVQEDEDDDFKDPMMDFLTKKHKSKSKHKHKHKHRPKVREDKRE